MGNELATINTSAGWMQGAIGSLQEAQPVAEMLAKSALVPKAYQGKPSDIIVACAMGAAVGLSPLQALAGIAVVNGRATLYGDSMLAVCQQRLDWGGIATEWPSANHCRVTVTRILRNGQTTTGVGEFSDSDAKRAGLWTKAGPWSQYPQRMLEIRARAFALRNVFADALAGFHCREEVEDYREVEATVAVTDKPQRKTRQIRTVTVEQPEAPAIVPDAPVDVKAEAIVPPTQPAIEEVIDEEQLAEFRKTLASASKRFTRAKVKELMESICGHSVEKAEDVDIELRGKVIEALCALEA